MYRRESGIQLVSCATRRMETSKPQIWTLCCSFWTASWPLSSIVVFPLGLHLFCFVCLGFQKAANLFEDIPPAQLKEEFCPYPREDLLFP